MTCIKHHRTKHFHMLLIFPETFEIGVRTYDSNRFAIWDEIDQWLQLNEIECHNMTYAYGGGSGGISFKNEADLTMFLLEWR